MKELVKTHDSYVSIEIQGHTKIQSQTDLYVQIVNDEHHVMCFDLDKEDAIKIANAILAHYSGAKDD